MKLTLFFLLTLVISLPCFAEETTALPKPANDIMDKLNKDIIELKKKSIILLEKVKLENTKKGDLKSAIMVDDVIARLKAESIIDVGASARGIAHGKYTIKAKCDNVAIIYINGKQILICSDVDGDAQYNVAGPIIITVKCNNSGGPKGFIFRMYGPNGSDVISTTLSDQWKSFKPKNETSWFSFDGISSIAPVVNGDTPWRIDGVSPIWGDGNGDICYLVWGK